MLVGCGVCGLLWARTSAGAASAQGWRRSLSHSMLAAALPLKPVSSASTACWPWPFPCSLYSPPPQRAARGPSPAACILRLHSVLPAAIPLQPVFSASTACCPRPFPCSLNPRLPLRAARGPSPAACFLHLHSVLAVVIPLQHVSPPSHVPCPPTRPLRPIPLQHTPSKRFPPTASWPPSGCALLQTSSSLTHTLRLPTPPPSPAAHARQELPRSAGHQQAGTAPDR